MIPAAAQHADVLRRIGDDSRPIESINALAAELQSDPSNFRRTLKAMEDEGLVIRPEGRLLDLSPAGRRTVLGLDVADGLAEVGTGAGEEPRVSHGLLRPNPLNPRKIFADGEIAGLADTIAEAGDVLQAIIVSPPDDNGGRIIMAGERRWRATCLLEGQGRLPEALREGLPYRVREFSAAEGLFIGLVENGQREALTPWEDARALAAYQVETGLSAREIAKRLGRSPDGTETGVRDVQEKIKVAKEAKADDVARHERGDITWEELRATVKTKAPAGSASSGTFPVNFSPSVAQGYAVAQLAHKLKSDPWDTGNGVYAEVSAAAYSDRDFMRLKTVGFLATFSNGKRHGARLSSTGRDWLTSTGYPTGHTEGERYSTSWLNLTDEQGEEPGLPLAPDGVRERLSLAKELLLVEVGNRVWREDGFEDGGNRIAPVGKYWLDAAASDLQAQGLILFAHKGPAGPHAGLTTAGWAYLEEYGIDPTHADHLAEAYSRSGQALWPGPGYVTGWLNEVPAPASTLEPREVEAESPAADLLGDPSPPALDPTWLGEALAGFNDTVIWRSEAPLGPMEGCDGAMPALALAAAVVAAICEGRASDAALGLVALIVREDVSGADHLLREAKAG